MDKSILIPVLSKINYNWQGHSVIKIFKTEWLFLFHHFILNYFIKPCQLCIQAVGTAILCLNKLLKLKKYYGTQFTLPLFLFILLVQIVTIFMAKLLGRSVRLWCWISLLLPLISWIILICLPVKQGLAPVKDKNLFNK